MPISSECGSLDADHDWWPNQLSSKVLHQPSPLADPMGESFDYAKELESLNLAAVTEDLRALTRRPSHVSHWEMLPEGERASSIPPRSKPSALRPFPAILTTCPSRSLGLCWLVPSP
jgi:hypothetical protein